MADAIAPAIAIVVRPVLRAFMSPPVCAGVVRRWGRVVGGADVPLMSG
jgi:hypothetical protein